LPVFLYDWLALQHHRRRRAPGEKTKLRAVPLRIECNVELFMNQIK